MWVDTTLFSSVSLGDPGSLPRRASIPSPTPDTADPRVRVTTKPQRAARTKATTRWARGLQRSAAPSVGRSLIRWRGPLARTQRPARRILRFETDAPWAEPVRLAPELSGPSASDQPGEDPDRTHCGHGLPVRTR